MLIVMLGRSISIPKNMMRIANVQKATMNGKSKSVIGAEFADWSCCSDYNFILDNDRCVPAGPEPIPAGVCVDRKTFQGSSGYRKIPGNTCTGGVDKDKPVEKDCSKGFWKSLLIISAFTDKSSAAAPPEGKVVHQNVCISSAV